MDRDEILRLKQITGLAALFKDVKFGKAWQPAEEDMDEAAAAFEYAADEYEEDMDEEEDGEQKQNS